MPKLGVATLPSAGVGARVKAFKENIHAICRSWSRSSFGDGGSCVSAHGSLGRARLCRCAGAHLRRAARLLLLEESLASRPACGPNSGTYVRAPFTEVDTTGVRGSRHRSCASIAAVTAPGFARPSSICGARTRPNRRSDQRAAPALSARVVAMPRRAAKEQRCGQSRERKRFDIRRGRRGRPNLPRAVPCRGVRRIRRSALGRKMIEDQAADLVRVGEGAHMAGAL